MNVLGIVILVYCILSGVGRIIAARILSRTAYDSRAKGMLIGAVFDFAIAAYVGMVMRHG